MSARRIGALEGLRGAAAAIVVVRHTTNAIAMPEATRRTLLEGPWAPLLDAQAAVALFFVLSGFVLAGSLARDTGTGGTLQFWEVSTSGKGAARGTGRKKVQRKSEICECAKAERGRRERWKEGAPSRRKAT